MESNQPRYNKNPFSLHNNPFLIQYYDAEMGKCVSHLL